MTVAELIKLLVDMPMDARIVITDSGAYEGDTSRFLVIGAERQQGVLNGCDVELIELQHKWDIVD